MTPSSELGCDSESGNRFFWIERAFCDLPSNGPEKAHGIIIWNHGISGTTEAWRAPVPPVFRLLQVRGWDVVIIKRHNLAEADANVSLYRSVERTLEQVRQERRQGYRKIVLAGQSFGGYITGGKFAFLYGLCLSEFLTVPTLPAGRFACPALETRAVISELLLLKEGAPKLLEDPTRAPAEVRALVGRWYAVLEDTFIFFALVDHGGTSSRVLYRTAAARLGGGTYDATIENGRISVTLPNRSRIVVEPTPIGPTLTWTSADGIRVLKAPLVKVDGPPYRSGSTGMIGTSR